ncbi:hypothetical protein H0H92_012219 [Tricholoma furcatifolium]|nr:hypothetical protein H0H92_012219 [Tricholoma furcatifolium]
MHLLIKHVDKITIWYNGFPPCTIYGIQIEYTLTNQTQPVTKMHGSTKGRSQVLTAEENEFFVGAYGLVDSGTQPVLRSIGFLKYNSKTHENSSTGSLETLSIYSFETGTGYSGA